MIFSFELQVHSRISQMVIFKRPNRGGKKTFTRSEQEKRCQYTRWYIGFPSGYPQYRKKS